MGGTINEVAQGPNGENLREFLGVSLNDDGTLKLPLEVVASSTVGTASGWTAGTTVGTFHKDDTYSGGSGTGYTLNGVVAALKAAGILAA